jgi:hypothetical protein
MQRDRQLHLGDVIAKEERSRQDLGDFVIGIDKMQLAIADRVYSLNLGLIWSSPIHKSG